MSRRDHLRKAADALGQAIEHLRRANEDDLAARLSRNFEEDIDDLIDVEPRGRDTDNAYEQMREMEEA